MLVTENTRQHYLSIIKYFNNCVINILKYLNSLHAEVYLDRGGCLVASAFTLTLSVTPPYANSRVQMAIKCLKFRIRSNMGSI